MADKALITGTALCKHKETNFADFSHCSLALTLLKMIVSGLSRNEKENCWKAIFCFSLNISLGLN